MGLKKLGDYFLGKNLDDDFLYADNKLEEHILDSHYLWESRRILGHRRRMKQVLQGNLPNIAQVILGLHLYTTGHMPDLAVMGCIEGFRGIMNFMEFNKKSIREATDSLIIRYNSKRSLGGVMEELGTDWAHKKSLHLIFSPLRSVKTGEFNRWPFEKRRGK